MADEKQQDKPQGADRPKGVEANESPKGAGAQQAPGGGKLAGGEPPTGDKAPQSVLDQHEALKSLQGVDPKSQGGDFNPTTPDGSPPPNNLPGPHGPQGVEHLQQDPAAS